ncbi:hypothetical protein [Devosia sp.]|uniref:hypothetical protein n=1 Tax=Devosia sp. TaxID=1871048 RepID=UPI0026316200|nr:hypothetical protein [Devosia sp.]
MSENDGGFWPTPCARDYRSPGTSVARSRMGGGGQPLSVAFKQRFGHRLTASFVEYLMGYAPRHTALSPWATAWFRPARAKRSNASPASSRAAGDA